MYKEVDEASTTASMGATPKRPDIFEKKKKKKEYKKVQEAMDRKYEQLIEGYRDFALSDSKMSPARKVNASIRDVAKKLKEIEETVKWTGRLKTESGISHSGFSSGRSSADIRMINKNIRKSKIIRRVKCQNHY